jgi:hypothetical protein
MSDDDPTGERLRSVLRAGAADVRPADDSLGRILARAHDERRSSRRWLAPLAAVAAVVIVAAGVAAGLGLRGNGGHSGGAGSHVTTPSVSVTDNPAPSESGSPTPPQPSPSVSGLAGGPAVALPAYYGATFESKVRLYREFRASHATDHVAGALQLMLGGAQDPDYGSLWPAGTTLTSLTRTGSQVAVGLSQPPTDPLATAVQEVVYTVTAADPSVSAVSVTWPGGSVGPTRRVAQWLVLAPVWVLTPVDGSTVRSPLTIAGSASVFEATVSWEVDRTDGTKVKSGSTMATIGAPQRGLYSVSVPLPPGTYVVKALEFSAEDGRPTWVDSKTVTVR